MASLGQNARKLQTLMFPMLEPPAADEHNVGTDRFNLPHMFSPQLRIIDAFFFAIGAFSRILLGSLMFAVWGAYTLLAWSSIPNLALRVLTVTAMILGFLVSMALLMIGIALIGGKVRPRSSH